MFNLDIPPANRHPPRANQPAERESLPAGPRAKTGFQAGRQAAVLDSLGERIASFEHRYGKALKAAARGSTPVHAGAVPLNIPGIDTRLPWGGLARHALHEAVSAGADIEHAAAATLFVAGLLVRLDGPVLWVLRQADLFAPALANVGLTAERLIFAEAGKHVLAIMEDGLRHPGLVAVVGEVDGPVSLVASRRLQTAAEQAGVMAVLLRRSQTFDDPGHHAPTAASTRWRVSAMTSDLNPGQDRDRARWRLDLLHCRGGRTGSWIVEACDETGCLGLVADSATRSDPAA